MISDSAQQAFVSWIGLDDERLLDRFDQQWQSQPVPDLVRFVDERLSNFTTSDRRRLLSELIKIDLEYRWRQSACESRPRIEGYFQQFPELAGSVELIAEEYFVRHRWGDAPQHSEFQNRFPDFVPELAAALCRIDNELLQSAECPPAMPSSQLDHSASTMRMLSGTPPRRSLTPSFTKDIDIPQALGRYSVERLLGKGAFGYVLLAHDPQLQRQVAIKAPHDALWREENIRKRFLHEARLAATLRHAALVSVYDILEADDKLYLVMEYIVGQTLSDQMQRRRTPREIAELVAEIAAAAHAAHQIGLVHRDLKPGNILIDNHGHPHITDFGLAVRQDALLNSPRELAGTPFYMAPEQIRRAHHQMDGRLDIWSIGVILYELLTLRRPFTGSSFAALFESIERHDPQRPGEINPDVPAELEAICLRCLSKGLPQRYTTGDELRQDLVRFLRDNEFGTPAHLSHSSKRENAKAARNLPQPTNSFVGRREELKSITSMLTETKQGVVTLIGPGGIGKTRLALQAAIAMQAAFEEGCRVIDLSSATSAAEVAAEVLHAFGVPLRSGQSAEEQVAAVLGFRGSLLLLLDNFEQAVEQSAQAIAQWQMAAPQARFLITSRACLGIAGEYLVELQPLPLPSATRQTNLAQIERAESVELFVQRAREVQPSFQLTVSNAGDVAEICRRVEGIPLAVELAAARVHVLSPAQIVAKLAENLQSLRSTRRDLSPRQQTLTAAVDWSFQLLAPWEQQALLHFSVFPSGFTFEAAEAVFDAIDLPVGATADFAVERLCSNCLLRRCDGEDGYRFGMYHMIRQYAQKCRKERFTPQQERNLQVNAAQWLTADAEKHNALLHTSAGPWALRRLTQETENILASCDWCIEHGEHELAARLLLTVCESLDMRGKLSDQVERLDTAALRVAPELASQLGIRLSQAHHACGQWQLSLQAAQRAVDLAAGVGAHRTHALALEQFGEMSRLRGDWAVALQSFQQGEQLARASADERCVAMSLSSQGMILWQSGELDNALEYYARASAIAHDLGDEALTAAVARNRGHVLLQRGQCQAALACFEQAVAIARGRGDCRATHRALTSRGSALAELGDYDTALTCYQEAEAIARETGERRSIAVNLANRGLALADRGRYEESLPCFQAAEALNSAMSMTAGVAINLGNRGAALGAMGKHNEALSALRAAEKMHRDLGNRLQIAINQGDAGVVLWKLGNLSEARTALLSALATFRDLSADRSLDYFDFQSTLACLEWEASNITTGGALVVDSLHLAQTLNIRDDHPRLRTLENFTRLQKLKQQLPPVE